MQMELYFFKWEFFDVEYIFAQYFIYLTFII